MGPVLQQLRDGGTSRQEVTTEWRMAMPDQDELDKAHSRMEALEARIEELERRFGSQQHGGPGPKYYESGSIHPELDDQTIAP